MSKLQSASGNHDLSLKRVRRTAEPTFKACADEALDRPWSELELSTDVLFSMAQVCHFSHATFVQSETVPHFSKPAQSVLVEAATGSGKTLAFVLPTLERLVRNSQSYYRAHGVPLRSRRIVGAILSPNRVLAQQTFIVARSVACRATQIVRFVLCDATVQPLDAIVAHLRRAVKITGVVLVGTPSDVELVRCAVSGVPFVPVSENDRDTLDKCEGVDTTEDWAELAAMATGADLAAPTATADADSAPRRPEEKDGDSDGLDEEELEMLRIARAKKAARRNNAQAASQTSGAAGGGPDDIAELRANPGYPFLVVIDEADVVLKSASMRVHALRLVKAIEAAGAAPAPSRRKAGADETLPAIDIGLFGATINSSEHAAEFLASCGSILSPAKKITLATSEQYVSKLQNRFMYCPANDMLQTLIHMVNAHPTKKHFVFFNSVQVLNHVRLLMKELVGGRRPILHIGKVFTLHEGMKDSAKVAEFGRFLRYTGPEADAAEMAEKTKNMSVKMIRKLAQNAESRVEDTKRKTLEGFANGSKQSGSNLVKANGAVMLCTDVAAFGLDVRDVEYVLHFEAPTTVRSFIHRIGRVARMGMRGISTMLLPISQAADGAQNARMREYVTMLSKAYDVQLSSIAGSVAPITPNIRAIIEKNDDLVASAKLAVPAMLMTEGSWFDADTAIDALTAGAGR